MMMLLTGILFRTSFRNVVERENCISVVTVTLPCSGDPVGTASGWSWRRGERRESVRRCLASLPYRLSLTWCVIRVVDLIVLKFLKNGECIFGVDLKKRGKIVVNNISWSHSVISRIVVRGRQEAVVQCLWRVELSGQRERERERERNCTFIATFFIFLYRGSTCPFHSASSLTRPHPGIQSGRTAKPTITFNWISIFHLNKPFTS